MSAIVPFIVFSTLMMAVSAHPTNYPSVDAEKWLARMRDGDMPPFLSYHIHCLFVPHENSSVAPAMELRQKMIDHFGLAGTTPCNGTMHQGRICMFDVELESGAADSPFVTANWAIFLTVDKFNEYVTWTMQNRGNNIIFVHPNTGFQKLDHFHWALWQGDIWPLRSTPLCDDCKWDKNNQCVCQ